MNFAPVTRLGDIGAVEGVGEAVCDVLGGLDLLHRDDLVFVPLNYGSVPQVEVAGTQVSVTPNPSAPLQKLRLET